MNSNRRSLAQIFLPLIFFATLPGCLLQPCPVKWFIRHNWNAIGGTLYDTLKTTNACKEYCAREDQVDCAAVDINEADPSNVNCYVHRSMKTVEDVYWDLNARKLKVDVNQYIPIRDGCGDMVWTKYPDERVRNGLIIYGIKSEAECKSACEAFSKCVAVEFSISHQVDNNCYNVQAGVGFDHYKYVGSDVHSLIKPPIRVYKDCTEEQLSMCAGKFIYLYDDYVRQTNAYPGDILLATLCMEADTMTNECTKKLDCRLKDVEQIRLLKVEIWCKNITEGYDITQDCSLEANAECANISVDLAVKYNTNQLPNTEETLDQVCSATQDTWSCLEMNKCSALGVEKLYLKMAKQCSKLYGVPLDAYMAGVRDGSTGNLLQPTTSLSLLLALSLNLSTLYLR